MLFSGLEALLFIYIKVTVAESLFILKVAVLWSWIDSAYSAFLPPIVGGKLYKLANCTMNLPLRLLSKACLQKQRDDSVLVLFHKIKLALNKTRIYAS